MPASVQCRPCDSLSQRKWVQPSNLLKCRGLTKTPSQQKSLPAIGREAALLTLRDQLGSLILVGLGFRLGRIIRHFLPTVRTKRGRRILIGSRLIRARDLFLDAFR